ncbi:MAG TPA: glutamine amidotransferase [Chthoniobacterales bacterium]|nr:glutamine amidotransferase [Chthoniobacterales bacterium]
MGTSRSAPTPNRLDVIEQYIREGGALIMIGGYMSFQGIEAKAQNKVLMLELMHFPQEVLNASEIKAPSEKTISNAEMRMAQQLIESMTSKWEPERYTDEYHRALEKMIDEKIDRGGKAAPAPSKKKRPSNLVDLTSALRQSLQQSESKTKAKPAVKGKAKNRKKAA